MKIFFVDFNGFQHGSESLKFAELCVLQYDGNISLKFSEEIHHKITFGFRQTKPWQSLSNEQKRTYNYQRKYVHHLPWSTMIGGIYDRNRVASIIKMKFKINEHEDIFYVLGKQKLDFLRKEFPEFQWSAYELAESFTEIDQNMPNPTSCACSVSAEAKCLKLATYFSHGVMGRAAPPRPALLPKGRVG